MNFVSFALQGLKCNSLVVAQLTFLTRLDNHSNDPIGTHTNQRNLNGTVIVTQIKCDYNIFKEKSFSIIFPRIVKLRFVQYLEFFPKKMIQLKILPFKLTSKIYSNNMGLNWFGTRKSIFMDFVCVTKPHIDIKRRFIHLIEIIRNSIKKLSIPDHLQGKSIFDSILINYKHGFTGHGFE